MARKLKNPDRFGSRMSAMDAQKDTPVKAPSTAGLDADVAKIGAKTKQGMSDAGSFGAAFRAARKEKGAGSTFTWNGKSYSTNMASDKPTSKPAARSTTSSTPTSASKPTAAAAPKPAAGANPPSVKQVVSAAKAAPKPAYTPSPDDTRAAKLAADAAAARKRAADTKDYSGSAIYSRLQNALGITSARENIAKTLQQQAQRKRWADVTAQGEQDKTAAVDAQKRADRIAAGNKPNATMTEKFYANNPDAMKKGGTVKKLAKGGKAKMSTKDWEGSAKDEAQDKKLAKKHGMSFDKWEKSSMDTKHDKQKSMKGLRKGGGTKKFASGGSIDGIAQRGKTRCKGAHKGMR